MCPDATGEGCGGCLCAAQSLSGTETPSPAAESAVATSHQPSLSLTLACLQPTEASHLGLRKGPEEVHSG